MQILLYALIATGFVMYFAVAILLVRTYRRTRDVGFIWLGVAILVWPLVTRALGVVINHGGIGPFPITGPVIMLVGLSQQITSLVLLMIAVLHLGKSKATETRAA